MNYWLHVVGGMVAVALSIAVLASKKGGSVHRASGKWFIICMTIAALSSFVFMFEEYQAPSLYAALFTIYAVFGAFLALQRPSRLVMLADWLVFFIGFVSLVVLCLDALEAIRLSSPFIIAIALLAVIFAVLVVNDIRYFRMSEKPKTVRIKRHMSRMVWGFAIVVQAPLVTLNSSFELGIPFPIAYFAPYLVVPVMYYYFLRRAPIKKRETTA